MGRRTPSAGGGQPQQGASALIVVISESTPSLSSANSWGDAATAIATLAPEITTDDDLRPTSLTLQLDPSGGVWTDQTITGAVWDDDGGQPGTLVATSPPVPVATLAPSMEPVTFTLDPSVVLPPGVYHVGAILSALAGSGNISLGAGGSAPDIDVLARSTPPGSWASSGTQTTRPWYQLRGYRA